MNKKSLNSKNKSKIKEAKLKETKESITESSSEEEFPEPTLEAEKKILEEEKKKKIQKYHREISNVKKAIKRLEEKTDSESLKKKETLIKFLEEIKKELEEIKNEEENGMSFCFILFLFIFFALMLFSKLNEEFYHNFNWENKDNYYEILKISPKIEKSELKKVYRELVRNYHPDKNPNCKECPEKFVLIQNAYEILSDDKQRKIYDETNGVINFLNSSSNEITNKNYDDLITFSEDIWIVQVYENQNYGSELFAKFWEDIYPEYFFLKFGRIDFKNQKSLIRKIPFGVREFPMVYNLNKFKHSEFAEIFLRGNISRDFKKFIFQTVKDNLVKVDQEIVDQKNIVFIYKKFKAFPQIMLNYYVKILREFLNFEVRFVNGNKNLFKVFKNNEKIIESDIKSPKEFFPKLFDYLVSITDLELNQTNYLRFCKDKKTKCLIYNSSLKKKNDLLNLKNLTQGFLKSKLLENGKYNKYLATFFLEVNLESQKRFGKKAQNLKNNTLILKNENNSGIIISLDDLSEYDFIDQVPFEDFRDLKTLFDTQENFYHFLLPENFNFVNTSFYIVWEEFFGFNLYFLGLCVCLFILVKKLKVSFLISISILFFLMYSYSIRKIFADYY